MKSNTEKIKISIYFDRGDKSYQENKNKTASDEYGVIL
jgi:hypothetical protein